MLTVPTSPSPKQARLCPIAPVCIDTASEARWFVLHTKARQEQMLARSLEAAGIECDLPLIERVKFRGRRKVKIDEPVFSSYLFMHGTVEATYFATATKRVANVLHIADQQRFLSERAALHLAIEQGAVLRPDSYLEQGCRVRVRSGPFRGLEGIVDLHARHDRLVLQVAALGRATSLEIDADLLEPVDP
jgi:transcriptional antiterminator RfaH